MDSVVLFPNSETEVQGDTVWSTEAVREFIYTVSKSCTVMMAAAAAPHSPDSRHNSVISDFHGFRFYSLGNTYPRETKKRSRIGILYFYSSAFLKLLLQIPKAPVWYIFLPGHMGTLACCVCCLLGKRFGVYLRGEWPDSGFSGVLYRWYFRKASFIYATGASFTHTMRAYNKQVVEVSPMMRFTADDFHQKKTYAMGGRTTGESARILYVGAIDPLKGLFEVVRALPQVIPHFDVELKVIGTGNPSVTKKLASEIQASGCADRIELVGHVGDKRELARWFTSADVFAFPTYYQEGFPRVVYEAMGYGLPVICSDIEGGKRFLRNKENCLIATKKNVDHLAQCLIQILSSQSLRMTLGKQAFQDVQDLCKRFEGVTHGSQIVETLKS